MCPHIDECLTEHVKNVFNIAGRVKVPTFTCLLASKISRINVTIKCNADPGAGCEHGLGVPIKLVFVGGGCVSIVSDSNGPFEFGKILITERAIHRLSTNL